jgi:hypothetical protein
MNEHVTMIMLTIMDMYVTMTLRTVTNLDLMTQAMLGMVVTVMMGTRRWPRLGR